MKRHSTTTKKDEERHEVNSESPFLGYPKTWLIVLSIYRVKAYEFVSNM